jgi:hypothetical protein
VSESQRKRDALTREERSLVREIVMRRAPDLTRLLEEMSIPKTHRRRTERPARRRWRRDCRHRLSRYARVRRARPSPRCTDRCSCTRLTSNSTAAMTPWSATASGASGSPCPEIRLNKAGDVLAKSLRVQGHETTLRAPDSSRQSSCQADAHGRSEDGVGQPPVLDKMGNRLGRVLNVSRASLLGNSSAKGMGWEVAL